MGISIMSAYDSRGAANAAPALGEILMIGHRNPLARLTFTAGTTHSLFPQVSLRAALTMNRSGKLYLFCSVCFETIARAGKASIIQDKAWTAFEACLRHLGMDLWIGKIPHA